MGRRERVFESPRAATIVRGVERGAVRCDNEYVDASARVKRHSKSQDGEDRYLVDTYFKGLCGGTYLELGALDVVQFSNSHLFEFGFGWSGVLIEPNPKSFKAL